jgi:Tol biopolymer transport system component
MRMPVSGGAPHLIAETAAYISIGCPISSGTECIMFEPSPDRKQTVLSSFDPEGGKHRELFRIDASERGPLCSISSDGSQFACLLRSSQEGRIQFLSLTGQIKREIQLEGWTGLNSLDWTPDGKMLVSSGGTGRATLLLVDLDGRVQPLWEQKTLQRTWAIASPNGNYVALMGKTDNSNAWLLENF